MPVINYTLDYFMGKSGECCCREAKSGAAFLPHSLDQTEEEVTIGLPIDWQGLRDQEEGTMGDSSSMHVWNNTLFAFC